MVDHWAIRDFAVLSHAAQMTNPVWIAGDSITEGNAITSVCGRPVLNVGYGGIGVLDLRNRLLTLYPHAVPSTLVVMIGTNDSTWAHQKPDTWRGYLGTLAIDAWNAGVKRVIIGKSPRVEWKGLVAAGQIVPDGIQAVRHQAEFLGNVWGMTLFDPSPTDPAGTTVDGVHLTGAAYTHLNTQLVNAVCP
jgi:hypothetical protein